MSWTALAFGALPIVAFAAALLGLAYRWLYDPVPILDGPAPVTPPGARHWSTFAVLWGLTGLLGLHLVAFVAPGAVLAWNGSAARLYLLEGALLGLGTWALAGLVVGVIRARRTPAPTRWVDALLVILVAVFLGAGVVVAVRYRFATYWGAGVVVPWLRSLLGGAPRPELAGALPALAQIQISSLFAAAVVAPHTRWLGLASVPAGRAARFVTAVRRTVVEPPSTVRPRLTWGRAYRWGLGVFLYFTIATVWFPSFVVGALAEAPAAVRDVAGLAAWGLPLLVGMAALRLAQRGGRL